MKDFCIQSLSSIKTTKNCKYLGVFLDSQLLFNAHIKSVEEKLSRQCAILSKLRRYVPRQTLLQSYSCNVEPIVQYGILVYGGVSFSSLELIRILERKILRVICFESGVIRWKLLSEVVNF